MQLKDHLKASAPPEPEAQTKTSALQLAQPQGVVRCKLCKQPLRAAKSIAVGMGPTCAKKVRSGLPQQKKEPVSSLKLERTDGVARIVDPTAVDIAALAGVEPDWGRVTHGTFALAVAVLAKLFPAVPGEPSVRWGAHMISRSADRLRIAFVREILLGVPHEGGVVKPQELKIWLKRALLRDQLGKL